MNEQLSETRRLIEHAESIIATLQAELDDLHRRAQRIEGDLEHAQDVRTRHAETVKRLEAEDSPSFGPGIT